MTHKGTSDDGLLSIDLSSERVRNALLLLEGVQQGQSLNVLVGYVFEAGLHALQLDKYAQPFRDRFPIIANKLTPSSDPSETVAASNVVDGLALRTAWDSGQLPNGQNWGTGLPGPGADQNSVIGLLQIIDDYADALGDLAMSEAVFQIIRGNFGRAGTLMDAISKGSRPPNPEVINTPRGGLDLTHRATVLFAGNPVVNAAWNGLTNHPRAMAEPWLDAWLSQLLPDPNQVLCNVNYQDGGGPVRQPVSLRDLDIGPLDVLSMSDVTQTPQKGELERRILLAAAIPPDATNVRIDFEPAAPPPGTIFFPDAFFLAKSLRSLISSARPLTPQDLTVPEVKTSDAGGAVDLADLRARASAARTGLTKDLKALTDAIPGLPANPDPVRTALLGCSFYGVSGSIPLTSSGPDANLSERTASVAKILQDRLNQATAVNIPAAQAADLLGLFGAIFGGDALEEVLFLRDDMAAMAWAVEHQLQGDLDAPLDAYGMYLQRIKADPLPPPPKATLGGPEIYYTLETSVPDNWIPMVPVQSPQNELFLRRGTMEIATAGGFVFLKAHALILEPQHPFFVADRVVSRAGVLVDRYFRRTRSADGSTFVWMARKSAQGRGPGRSGLRFDIVRDMAQSA